MKRILIAVVLVVAIGSVIASVTHVTKGPWQMTSAAAFFGFEDKLESLGGAIAWINSEPLSAADLKGKVVLVQFWTYSCINWLRVQPYVRQWAETYKDKGLVVIGVHTPEFSFEKNLETVRWATDYLDVDYPVAVDTDYTIWRAFNNNYWPALYFIDARGNIRHRQFGEGEYERSEEVIRELVAEAGFGEVSSGLAAANGVGAEAPPDWENLGTPETYLGYIRTRNFDSPGGIERNIASAYSVPDSLHRNHWALAGTWTIGNEAIRLDDAPGRVAFRFQSRDVHLVMGPPPGGPPVRFRVRVDGAPPGEAHGSDVDAAGDGIATHQRLYHLIRQTGEFDDRLFEIEFLDAGVEAFSFTFG